jgi:hypothetical protein
MSRDSHEQQRRSSSVVLREVSFWISVGLWKTTRFA